MGRRTILFGENMTLGAAGGLVLAAFQTAATGAQAAQVEVTRIEISQNGSTTLAMVRGMVSVRNTAGTLAMTAATPSAAPGASWVSGLTGNAAPAGAPARSGINSSTDTGGTYTDIFPFNFANLNGYLWKPDMNEQLLVPPSTLFTVRLLAAPTTLTGWTVVLYLDEG